MDDETIVIVQHIGMRNTITLSQAEWLIHQ